MPTATPDWRLPSALHPLRNTWDVHHVSNGSEVTDHFVNEYRMRLIADRRTDVNPDGLWIAEYSERPIDGERRDRILAAPDRVVGQE